MERIVIKLIPIFLILVLAYLAFKYTKPIFVITLHSAIKHAR